MNVIEQQFDLWENLHIKVDPTVNTLVDWIDEESMFGFIRYDLASQLMWDLTHEFSTQI